MQTAIDSGVTTEIPKPHRRYAEAAAAMREAGIDVRDDEYQRIDDFTSVQATAFLHLCGIAPFIAKVIAE